MIGPAMTLRTLLSDDDPLARSGHEAVELALYYDPATS